MVRFSAIKGFLDNLPHGQALPFCGDSQNNDKATYALMAEQLQIKNTQISKLHKEISELHILLQTTLNQNLVTAPDKDDKRPWWKFWA